LHPVDARELAWQLMRLHGLSNWKFEFDHARRRFGSCQSTRKVITLSRPLVLLNDVQQVRDTILHEIAHALTPGDGHGAKWRRKCAEIGANPKRCYDDTTVVSPARAPAPFRYGCQTCGWWVDRRRRNRGLYVCAKCRTKLVFEIKTILAS